MASKTIKRDKKGRTYDSRFFTEKQINSLRYEDKKIKLNTIKEKVIFKEKEIKINKERVDKKTGKLLKKGDVLKTFVKDKTIFTDENGKEVSSFKARKYNARLKENKKAFKRKLEKKQKENKPLNNKNIDVTCSPFYFDEFFDQLYDDFQNEVVIFNGIKLKSNNDLSDIFTFVRDLLKTKDYPKFATRCEYTNILTEEIKQITYDL
jgi:Mor family transcriptional regulator